MDRMVADETTKDGAAADVGEAKMAVPGDEAMEEMSADFWKKTAILQHLRHPNIFTMADVSVRLQVGRCTKGRTRGRMRCVVEEEVGALVDI